MFLVSPEPSPCYPRDREHLVRQDHQATVSSYLQEPNNERLRDLPEVLIRDLNNYGVCVVDDFLGEERGKHVLAEVLGLHVEGKFTDGKLMRPPPASDDDEASDGLRDPRHIRGDKITWIGGEGQDAGCANIGYLINQVDRVVMMANKMQNNGQLGNYRIRGRTKAMVACYPSFGTHYVKHVDNPNRDGRCITATYYLNPNWRPSVDGGTLRVFPENQPVLNISPQFDRIIFFWSDRRNPHAVEPAHRTRYAITLWYYDADERERALQRHRRETQKRLKDANR